MPPGVEGFPTAPNKKVTPVQDELSTTKQDPQPAGVSAVEVPQVGWEPATVGEQEDLSAASLVIDEEAPGEKAVRMPEKTFEDSSVEGQ